MSLASAFSRTLSSASMRYVVSFKRLSGQVTPMTEPQTHRPNRARTHRRVIVTAIANGAKGLDAETKVPWRTIWTVLRKRTGSSTGNGRLEILWMPRLLQHQAHSERRQHHFACVLVVVSRESERRGVAGSRPYRASVLKCAYDGPSLRTVAVLCRCGIDMSQHEFAGLMIPL